MHGDPSRADFTGMEGPDDPAHLALFACDTEGKPLAILYNNASHPTNFYGADFYSADFPGMARGFLRETLGPIPVLYWNGAFGDISCEQQGAERHAGSERITHVRRLAHLAAGETLRLLHETRLHDEVALGHEYEDLELPVRLPDPARLEEAAATLARFDAGEKLSGMEVILAHGATLLQERFAGKAADRLAIHALRIGDVGIATQPCELFCQFGLDIKRRSPAPLTGVAGIADGYGGYCPTVYGVLGGGYSGEPIYWTRFSLDGGYRIVDCACRLLHNLWRA